LGFLFLSYSLIRSTGKLDFGILSNPFCT